MASPLGFEPKLYGWEPYVLDRLYDGDMKWHGWGDSNPQIPPWKGGDYGQFVYTHNGRQGRTRTYDVSDVADLQSAAFAAQRHLTIKNPWCFARRTGLEPAVMVSQGWLTATCLTIRLISEQNIKKTSAVFSATWIKLTVLLPINSE